MAGDDPFRSLILAQLQALKQRALTRHAVKRRGVKHPPKKHRAPRRRASKRRAPKRRAPKHCALACCAPEPSELESFLFPILEQLTEDITTLRYGKDQASCSRLDLLEFLGIAVHRPPIYMPIDEHWENLDPARRQRKSGLIGCSWDAFHARYPNRRTWATQIGEPRVLTLSNDRQVLAVGLIHA
ncbi:hypothetical protein E8E14_009326 [Neopestalotiopsis sp. 37M]|nr:hypothetical protein E8E14_009326 [Neopestalotiopsis sp. 37M]